MIWDPHLYDAKHSYVAREAADLIDVLQPKPGERILDAGSGTGNLTALIAATGALVHGIDKSPEMVARARERHPEVHFEEADIVTFDPPHEFEAVFSNAALHWVTSPDAAVQTIAKSLRRGGRLVAEFGGKGNCAAVIEAIGIPCPWYFPTIGEYGGVLERHGFELRQASLFDRPTRLEDGAAGLRGWIRMFGPDWEIPDDIEDRLRSRLWREGSWWIDYRRLRIQAVRL